MGFEHEKGRVVEQYLKDLRTTVKQLDMLLIYLDTLKKSSVSAMNPLEAKISGILASHAAKEHLFKMSLVSLYKKYNRPHSLKLTEILQSEASPA